MLQATALVGLGATLGLVLVRPRVGSVRVGPAFAAGVGVLLMLLFGLVDRTDLINTSALMLRPLVAVALIMVTTAVAHEVGLVEHIAKLLGARAGTSAHRFFFSVYALSACTAAVLNNDSAILLVTPVVITMVRRAYPDNPRVWTAFAFAVFIAAGVAPLVVSNPMNMIVASYAGIAFNAYALHMTPVWLMGVMLGYGILRLLFAKDLASAATASEPLSTVSTSLSRPQRLELFVLALVLVAYPIVTYFDGPVWIVALSGAIAAASILPRGERARKIAKGISWDILAFLAAVSVLGMGLRKAGFVAGLSSVYAHGTLAIATVSALGSAIVNNHPMSIMNMLALADVPGAGTQESLAALVGGDIGPRLLPMGSLAGLLWLGVLRRLGIEVSTLRFASVGALVTVPALFLSVGLLALICR